VFRLDLQQSKWTNLNRISLEHPGESPYSRLEYRVCKRFFDILISGLLLFLLSPLLLLIMLLLKLTSKESVLFVQKRVGLNGWEFYIYKFRTLKSSVVDELQPKWEPTTGNDALPLGKILRRFNLDELPQLLNVLRGEMSLVGPRPERPYWVEVFQQQIPNYFLRHRIQVGITGWAQVHGWRGATSIWKRTEHDLYYFRHWSLWLDLKILFLTLTRGFGNRTGS